MKHRMFGVTLALCLLAGCFTAHAQGWFGMGDILKWNLPQRSGTVTNGNLPQFDASGNLADSGISASALRKNRIVAVSAGTNATVNGTALLTAYQTAVAMSPAVSNEVTLVLDPGVFDLGTNTLNITNEYVNIMGKIPTTITTIGPVVAGGFTNMSAVLTGDTPLTIITNNFDEEGYYYPAVTVATVQGTKISNIGFEGPGGLTLSRQGTNQIVSSCTFSGPVDYDAQGDHLVNTATFIDCYISGGFITDPAGAGCNFSGKMDRCVVTCGLPSCDYALFSGSLLWTTLTGSYLLGSGYGGGSSGVLKHCTVIGNNIGGSGNSMLIEDCLLVGDHGLGTDVAGGSASFSGTLRNSIVVGSMITSASSFYGTVEKAIIVGDFLSDAAGYGVTLTGTIRDSTLYTTNGLGTSAGSFGTASFSVINCDIYGDGNLNNWDEAGSTYTGMFISHCRFHGENTVAGMSNSVIQYTSGLSSTITNSPITISFCTLTNDVVIPNK